MRGFVIPGAGRYSRSQLDELIDQAKQLGASGLVWVRFQDGVPQCSVKAIKEGVVRAMLGQAKATPDDVLVLAAGQPDRTSKLLGQMRLNLARRDGLVRGDAFEFAWVVEFPLVEWNDEDQRWFSVNHPFTAPMDEDLHLLDSAPGRVRAKAYDITLNGWEIGGGSIRIHGLDRLIALLAGETSIREAIAFPKTAAAEDLMAGAPSPVDARQLRDLRLSVSPRA